MQMYTNAGSKINNLFVLNKDLLTENSVESEYCFMKKAVERKMLDCDKMSLFIELTSAAF